MADSSTLSFRVDAEIIDALETAAAEVGTSKSGMARDALIRGLEEMEDAPDYLQQQARKERIEAEHKQERRAGWFRSNFSDGMKKAMKKNLHPAEYRQSVAPYLEEAKELGEMPAPIQRETGSETYHEWCQDQLDYYAVAYEHQLFEHDAIEGPLDEHEGMENARQWVDRAELIAEANDPSGTVAGEPSKLAQTALNDGVVPEDVKEQARRAVESGEAGHLAAGVVDAAAALVDADNHALGSDTPEFDN
jgi:predicted DNA-binding protein